jgi:hypothetical protein
MQKNKKTLDLIKIFMKTSAVKRCPASPSSLQIKGLNCTPSVNRPAATQNVQLLT